MRSGVAGTTLTLTVLLTAHAVAVEPNGGQVGAVCVGVGVMPATVDRREAEVAIRGYTVQIDAREVVAVSREVPVQYDGLQLGKRHLVRVRRAGRLVASFRFTFESGRTESYCLFLEPYYSTWQLWPRSQERDPCKCQAPTAGRAES